MSDDLVNSAVTFLQDPKVADAPLAKRIAFLESKGLSAEQVQVALQRAQEASTSSSSQPATLPHQVSYPPTRPAANYSTYAQQQQQQQAPPPVPQRDWRDWFIMAVVSGGFSWAVYFLAKRYVIPLLSPPSQTQLEEDKTSISAQFDQVAEMLSILQADTETIKSHGAEQTAKIQVALTTVDAAVQDMKNKTERREGDMRRLGLEMDQLRDLIPSSIEAVRRAQTDALADLNGELRSLKTLLQNRIKATTGGAGVGPSPSSTTTTTTSTVAKSGSPAAVAGQAPEADASTPGKSAPASSSSDALGRFAARGGSHGIPEWQKSAVALGDATSSQVAAGSVQATADNVENGQS